MPPGPDGGAVLAWHVSRIQHVLHPDRKSLQRPGLRGGSGCPGLPRIEMGKRLNRGIAAGDMIQIGLDQRLRPQRAIMNPANRLARGQAEQITVHALKSPYRHTGNTGAAARAGPS